MLQVNPYKTLCVEYLQSLLFDYSLVVAFTFDYVFFYTTQPTCAKPSPTILSKKLPVAATLSSPAAMAGLLVDAMMASARMAWVHRGLAHRESIKLARRGRGASREIRIR